MFSLLKLFVLYILSHTFWFRKFMWYYTPMQFGKLFELQNYEIYILKFISCSFAVIIRYPRYRKCCFLIFISNLLLTNLPWKNMFINKIPIKFLFVLSFSSFCVFRLGWHIKLRNLIHSLPVKYIAR